MKTITSLTVLPYSIVAGLLILVSPIKVLAMPGSIDAVQSANRGSQVDLHATKARHLKTKEHAGAAQTGDGAQSTVHEYYVAYTGDHQISRNDFTSGKVTVTGSKGTVFVTNGLNLRLLAGNVTVSNGGNRSITVSCPTAIQIGPSISMHVTRDSSTEEIRCEPCTSSFESNGQEPLRLWAEDGAEFGVTKTGTVEFLKGEAVIQSSAPIKIKTLAGTIDSTEPVLASVRALTLGLFVENCLVSRVISVHTHSHTLSLRGGESCILVNAEPKDDMTPLDGIERRGLVAAYDGYMTVVKGEFSMVSVIKKFNPLYLAYKGPVTPCEKALMQTWIKSIAALSVVDSGNGKEDYSPQPKLAGTTKLGHFSLPTLAQNPGSN